MKTAPSHAPKPPIAPERLAELVKKLSVEEKAGLTAGADAWHAGGAPSLRLAPLVTSDGPNGIRGLTFPAGSTATCTPCGTALGATWDEALVSEVAARIGAEARLGGIHYMLGPVINLVRSPLAGRDFEAFSEDPFLTGRLGAAYVTGMQSQDVAATPKHFVANDAETARTSVDNTVAERTLRELYLVPFEAVAQAGAWAMMSAYNRVNGVYCSDHPQIVGGILRREWGWDGVLMSDWFGTHDTVRGALVGLDLEMPGPSRFFGRALADAVTRGEVDPAVLDEKVRRLLLLTARVGALPGTPAAKTRASLPALDPAAPWSLSDAEAAALVRRAAADSFVLLANDGILPLATARLKRVAVVGPNAAAPCTQGGGAAHISAPAPVTPLDGLLSALGSGAKVVHEPGCRIERFLPHLSHLDARDLDGLPGVTVEFFRGQEPGGEPAARWHMKASEIHLFGDAPGGLPQNDFSVRMSTWLTPAEDGRYTVAMRGFGGRRLYINGALAADEWDAPAAVDVPTALFEGKESGATLDLETGRRVHIMAELHSNEHAPCLLAIGCLPPEPADQLERAVTAAASAEVAVVVVGNDESWDTEGRDRTSTALPGRQDELVERVVAANPRTVVVVNAGSQVGMPWADKAAAIVYAWLPGQEFGNALADVLLGRTEPGGRLPLTIARREGDYGSLNTTPDADGRLSYVEGVNVGYRHFDAAMIEPLFCFGHGLSYTEFAFEAMTLSAAKLTAADLQSGKALEVRVQVRNTGRRAGKEVVQLYVADVEASVQRPPHELRAFVPVRLEPGESSEVSLSLDARAFAFWDSAGRAWRVEPGCFEIQIGRSSRDIRLRESIEIG
jgi:beta-glucosidase